MLTVPRAVVNPGSPDPLFRVEADGVIKTMVVLTNGQVMIGGLFQTINGEPRSRVARLNADGSLDFSFDPGSGPNAPVNALAIQTDGKVLIGGDFTTVSGTIRRVIARLNPNGALDTTFVPATGGSTTNARVNAWTPAGGPRRAKAAQTDRGWSSSRSAWLTKAD